MTNPEFRRPRGFAAMSIEQRQAIARQGGKAAHRSGNAHQFTSEEAAAAGRKRHENARQKARDEGRRVPQDDEAHEALDQD